LAKGKGFEVQRTVTLIDKSHKDFSKVQRTETYKSRDERYSLPNRRMREGVDGALNRINGKRREGVKERRGEGYQLINSAINLKSI
jgi:hypothetical protein